VQWRPTAWPSGISTGVHTCMCLAVFTAQLAFMPDGPWEQDEALLASGVIEFDVVKHQPHPPGYPLWILLGKLVMPVFGDALLSLRVLSCVAATVGFALLASLLQPLVGRWLAIPGALLYAFLPTVWFHAPRAFTGTSAVTLGLAAMWCCRSDRWRVLTPVALSACCLVRLPMVVEASVLIAPYLWLERRRAKRLVASMAVALVLGIATYGWAVVESGGFERFQGALADHVGRAIEHDYLGEPRWRELAFVRGLGGSGSTLAFIGAALVGWGVWLRRDVIVGVWIGVLATASLYSLVCLHPPYFPRYALAFLLVGTVLALVGVRAVLHTATVLILRRRPAFVRERWADGVCVVALTTTTLASVLHTLPAMRAARDTPLPVVAASRVLSSIPAGAVVASKGVRPFVKYDRLAGTLDMEVREQHDLARASFEGPYHLLGGRRLTVPGRTVSQRWFVGFPDETWELSQKRYREASLELHGIAVAEGMFDPEYEFPIPEGGRFEHAQPFVWLSPSARLYGQPHARRLVLRLRIDAQTHGSLLEVRVHDQVIAAMTLATGMNEVFVDLPDCKGPCAIDLAFDRSFRAHGDPRTFAAALHAAWCEGPGLALAPYRWSPGDRSSMWAYGVALAGVYGPERFFGQTRSGAWTSGHAIAQFPAGDGTIALTLARPAHLRGDVVISTIHEQRAVDVGPHASTHVFELGTGRGSEQLETEDSSWFRIDAPTFVPHEQNPQSHDNRKLAVILLEAEFCPKDRIMGSACRHITH